VGSKKSEDHTHYLEKHFKNEDQHINNIESSPEPAGIRESSNNNQSSMSASGGTVLQKQRGTSGERQRSCFER